MSALLVMIPISVLLAGFFVACFILSSKNNQFEDLEGPSVRILSDGEEVIKKKNLDKEE